MSWDNKKPTVQMLGRYQPFHDGHVELFKRAVFKTGQVIIMVRDVGHTEGNPFDYTEVRARIIERLQDEGYFYDKDFRVELVSNITEIVYGRDVGYQISKIDLPSEIEKISATKIRKRMKKEGLL